MDIISTDAYIFRQLLKNRKPFYVNNDYDFNDAYERHYRGISLIEVISSFEIDRGLHFTNHARSSSIELSSPTNSEEALFDTNDSPINLC